MGYTTLMVHGLPEHERDKIEELQRAMYSRSLSRHMKDKERRSLSETTEPVSSDWERPEPAATPLIVAPKTLSISRSLVRLALLGAVLFFLGSAGFFAYYFTFGGGALPASPANIDIS